MKPFGQSVDHLMGTAAAPEYEVEERFDWYELTTAVIAFLCVIGCFWFAGGAR